MVLQLNGSFKAILAHFLTIEWFIQSYLSTFSPEQREVIENEVNFEYRLSEIQETFYKLKNK